LRSWMKLVRTVTLLGQFGFTFITPPVVMGLLGWWLQSKFGLGTWVMLVAIVIGLLTSATSAYKFYLRVTGPEAKKTKAEPTEKPVVFYTHE